MYYKTFFFVLFFIFTSSFLSADEYSPGVGQDYPKKLLWGDTHLHSNQSADAYTIGNSNLTPGDAFRFARGEEVISEKGVRARISDDPSTYVCNDLIYRTLAAIEKEQIMVKFGFAHMPWLEKYRGQDIGVDINWEEKATMPLDEVVKGIELIIERD